LLKIVNSKKGVLPYKKADIGLDLKHLQEILTAKPCPGDLSWDTICRQNKL
jgi:hypothetical protein